MKVPHYKAYKPALREEFSYACAYCQNSEPELGGSEAFHVDHYKPKSKFPHLICKYANLIYACRYCNRNKSDYWPNFAEKMLDKVILNPRIGIFKEHINQSNFAWIGITAKGKWTVLKLRLDSSALIRRRQKRFLIEKAINRLEGILAQSQQGLSVAIEQRAEESEIQMFRQDIAEQIAQINALRQTIIGRLD